MEKAEIKQINNFLNDVQERLCEGDEATAMHLQLTELYGIIKLLMDETFKADHEFKPPLATLEYKARWCKECIESRLAVRN
jgi:hypothetical protein